MNEITPKTTPPENIKRDDGKKRWQHGVAAPSWLRWHGHANQHGVAVPHCWPVLHATLSRHDRAGWRGDPVPNCWNFHATPSNHFRDYKIASLALLSAKYCLSFRSFGKVLENTEKCYMSEIYAKGDRFDHFLIQSNMKM